MIGTHEGKNTIPKKVGPIRFKNAIEAHNCFKLYNKNVDHYILLQRHLYRKAVSDYLVDVFAFVLGFELLE
jgi:hypothetical protein